METDATTVRSAMLEAQRRERTEALATGRATRSSWPPSPPPAVLGAPEEGYDVDVEEDMPTSPGIYPEQLLRSLRGEEDDAGNAHPCSRRDTLVSKRAQAPTYLLAPPPEPRPPLPSSFAPRTPLLPPPPRDVSELGASGAARSSHRDPMAAVVAGLAIATLASLSFVGRTVGDNAVIAQTAPAVVARQGSLAGAAPVAASTPSASPAAVEILEPAPVAPAAPSATSPATPRASSATARPPVSPGPTRRPHPEVSARQDTSAPTAERAPAAAPRVEGHRLFGIND